MYFQDLILRLQKFWGEQGCVILQPTDMEMGAGTFHWATFLRAIGPKHWKKRMSALVGDQQMVGMEKIPIDLVTITNLSFNETKSTQYSRSVYSVTCCHRHRHQTPRPSI